MLNHATLSHHEQLLITSKRETNEDFDKNNIVLEQRFPNFSLATEPFRSENFSTEPILNKTYSGTHIACIADKYRFNNTIMNNWIIFSWGLYPYKFKHIKIRLEMILNEIFHWTLVFTSGSDL